MDKFRIYLCFSVVTFFICTTAFASSMKLLRGSISFMHQRFANGEITSEQFINTLIKIKMMHGSHTSIMNALSEGASPMIQLDNTNIDIELVKPLIEKKGMEVGDILFKAIYRGQLEIIKYLMYQIEEKGVKIGYGTNINAALSYAVMNGQLKVVKYLIEEKGIKTDEPLFVAVKYGRLNIVKYLIEEKGMSADHVELIGPEDHRSEVTLLQEASSGNHVEVARYLLSKGADVHVNSHKDVSGFTPLHSAAVNGSVKMAELLISYGADVNATVATTRDNEHRWFGMTGTTPLHLATGATRITDKNIEMANFLIANGAGTKAGE